MAESIREQIERMQDQWFSPYAARASHSRGRERAMSPCPLRTDFQRDRDRIVHCKAFRRLKHKTQCFISPEGDHYRTRLTHTLEVAQIARTVARALRLNEDLAEAISLGHDLGHTPFGHTGERTLNRLCPGGFDHAHQSLRVVETLEGEGGLNLTWEVRDGILNHPSDRRAATLEGRIVSLADRIAYINHDIDDALRGGVLQKSDLPSACLAVLGETHGQRIDTLVQDLVQNSMDLPELAMSAPVEQAMQDLRAFMFERVYIHSAAKAEEGRADHILEMLYRYYVAHPDQLPDEYHAPTGDATPEQGVVDYVAGMTDRYAVSSYLRLFVPKAWREF